MIEFIVFFIALVVFLLSFSVSKDEQEFLKSLKKTENKKLF